MTEAMAASWQPMRTAPIDGTEILLIGRNENHPNWGTMCFVAEWDDTVWTVFDSKRDHEIEHFIELIGWMRLPGLKEIEQ